MQRGQIDFDAVSHALAKLSAAAKSVDTSKRFSLGPLPVSEQKQSYYSTGRKQKKQALKPIENEKSSGSKSIIAVVPAGPDMDAGQKAEYEKLASRYEGLKEKYQMLLDEKSRSERLLQERLEIISKRAQRESTLEIVRKKLMKLEERNRKLMSSGGAPYDKLQKMLDRIAEIRRRLYLPDALEEHEHILEKESHEEEVYDKIGDMDFEPEQPGGQPLAGQDIQGDGMPFPPDAMNAANSINANQQRESEGNMEKAMAEQGQSLMPLDPSMMAGQESETADGYGNTPVFEADVPPEWLAEESPQEMVPDNIEAPIVPPLEGKDDDKARLPELRDDEQTTPLPGEKKEGLAGKLKGLFHK